MFSRQLRVFFSAALLGFSLPALAADEGIRYGSGRNQFALATGSPGELGLLKLLAEEFGIALEPATERERWIFVGDSPNDVPMFGFFPNSVGVANVLDFADRLEAKPAWITSARSGAGFVELAEALLAARHAGDAHRE